MPTDLRLESRANPIQLQSDEDTASTYASWRRRGITNLTVETPTRPRFAANELMGLQRARWRTPEFVIYAVIIAVGLQLMVRVPMRLSDSSHPNFPLFSQKLSHGWIPGRLVDNSDSQYRSFRNNLVPLTLLAFLFFFLSYVYSHATRTSSFPSVAGTSDRLRRIPFLAVFSIIMILFLHGSSALKIMFILLGNFSVGKLTCSSASIEYLGPSLTWAFNGLVLYSNEVYEGYKFVHLHPSLGILDTLNGFHPRWHVTFNITMLRMVSFNLDYYWASHSRHRAVETSTIEILTKERPKIPHDLKSYSAINYVAYVLYPPLFMAGPIITFNDFLWQFRRPPAANHSSTLTTSTMLYLTRFLFSLLTMELILHYMYVVAIKDSSAWQGDSPLEICTIGFWNLILVWLKLLVLWRFFRLWALLDGIDAPENVVRCMTNNYSTLAFWRSWHRSYNLWLLRYIYIPMGGGHRAVLSTMLVFTFVALWHDLSLRLLTWGWLVSLFIIPELTARWYFTPEKYGDRWWFRHLCAIGGIFNILALMSANLVGFAIGINGMKYMVQQLFGSWQGIQFLLVACVCLFAAVQVMFEYREEERRKGIFRRY